MAEPLLVAPDSSHPASPLPSNSNTAFTPIARTRFVSFQIEDKSDLPWVQPADHVERPLLGLRRSCGVCEGLILLFVVALGIYVIFTDSGLYKTSQSNNHGGEKARHRFFKDVYISTVTTSIQPKIFPYLLFTLVGDLAAFLIAFLLISSLKVCCGDLAVRHGMAFMSILLQVIQGGVCYASLGFGIYILLTLWFQDQLGSLSITLFSYLTLETFISLIYAIGYLPTIFGALKYVVDKVGHQIHQNPIVQFHQPDRPIHYVGYSKISDYDSSLSKGQFQRALPILVGEDIHFKEGEEIGKLQPTGNDSLIHAMGLDSSKNNSPSNYNKIV